MLESIPPAFFLNLICSGYTANDNLKMAAPEI
jgi:hypothetical protein